MRYSKLTKGSEYVQPGRTRHSSMRCSYLRHRLRNDYVPMRRINGKHIPADVLTKTLSGWKAQWGSLMSCALKSVVLHMGSVRYELQSPSSVSGIIRLWMGACAC